MSVINIKWGSAALLAGLLVAACAPTIPKELANARMTYDRVASGPASIHAQPALSEARMALLRAEDTYAAQGPSDETRQLALEAERKANAAQDMCAVNLAAAQPLSTENPPLVVTQTTTNTKVLSIPSIVLFEFGKADLLPHAKERLDEVASVLKNESTPGITFVVKGHTDAIGTEAYNQELSERRATVVRDRLVQGGVDPSRIETVGKGKDQPATTNATAEGRTHNRRVEIQIGTKKSDE